MKPHRVRKSFQAAAGHNVKIITILYSMHMHLNIYVQHTATMSHVIHTQARSQKFAMGGWGRSPQPPEARGCGGGAPSARKF